MKRGTTSTARDIRLTDRWLMGVKDRKADLEANMQRTLDAIKAAVEASRIDRTGL